MLAFKIAIGSSAAFYTASYLDLEFAASAGTITLLTIVTTKKETLKISLFRVVTFIISAMIAWILFQHISSNWIAYGIYIFMIVFLFEWLGWKVTVSVNAVIGSHFMTTHNFTTISIANEFLLVLIGISIAIILNFFPNIENQKKKLIKRIGEVEGELQFLLEEMALYLSNQPMNNSVWADIISLEKKLEVYTEQAYVYHNNALEMHSEYYVHYFEMRTKQCNVLHNLHYEVKKIRNLPKQAQIIADYITYLRDYVVEMNDPQEQIEKLEQLFEDMKKEKLPKTREEFESRAILYHILMDLEEFLVFKRRFVDSINEQQVKLYWEKKDDFDERWFIP